MRILHEHGEQRVEGEARGLGAGMLLLTNKKGNFCSLCPGENITKYNGLFHYDAKRKGYVKSLDWIGLADDQASAITNRFHTVERHHDHGAVERFTMSSKALHYRVERHHGELLLDLDMGRLGDESTEGRFYHVSHAGDALIIRFEKAGEYDEFLVIKGVQAFHPVREWQPRRHAYDERRGEEGERWIYRAGRISVEGALRLVIARSDTMEKALEKAAFVQEHEEGILQSQAAYARNAYKAGSLEANAALAALDALVTKRKGESYSGILAGLPWFHQYWSRDELVSLGALIAAGQYGLVKEILTRYYELLEEPHLMALYPDQGRVAADALGWLAKRTHDLLLVLEREGALDDYFTRLELAYFRERMAHALDALLVTIPVQNGPGETWMDTLADGKDGRAGVRIEIQALLLAAHRLVAWLEERRRFRRVLPGQWRRREKQYLERVRALFHDGCPDGLLDEEADRRARPNLLLAAYAYPDLFTSEEWNDLFEGVLPRLWLPWGGLASLDTAAAAFVPRYSGADDRSYHHGDSWYWVNALAALVLQRHDPERYATQIGRLRDACTQDLLFHGAVGHASELSSAAVEEWGGTYAQAWSAALLFELLQE